MKSRTSALCVTGLALFAMFFGAGNLIIPTMIGVEGGAHAWSAAVGFIASGVLLPVLSMMALASKEPSESHLTVRLGWRLGLVVTTLIFLFTGMLYVIPRVGAVSFEMAAAPVLGDAPGGLFAYSAVFFAVVCALALRPRRVVERIGVFLTPALLVLLVVLVVASWSLPTVNVTPQAAYGAHAPVTGFVQGYFTMDALAAQMFGGVIVGSLAARGFRGRALQRSTALAGVLAGGLLALIYLGLVRVGLVGSGANGAEVISHVAEAEFGRAGQALFGVIVLLACLTTALGLLEASVDFFHGLLRNRAPWLSRRGWLLVNVAVSFALTNLGLERILAVVAPANQLLYPMIICLVVVALVDAAIPGPKLIGREAATAVYRLRWSYRLPAWVAGLISIFEALWSTNLALFSGLRPALDAFPLGALQMAWVVPAGLALGVGLVLDAPAIARSRSARPLDTVLTSLSS